MIINVVVLRLSIRLLTVRALCDSEGFGNFGLLGKLAAISAPRGSFKMVFYGLFSDKVTYCKERKKAT